ncbi:hypothetical protein BN133_4316 [Cronobacter dublinensis 582]|nr:hypothetical protein BN133_4316 [Cronobacter dublinensis 582]
MLLRVFAGDRGDFRRQQAHDDAVFIGGPRRAVKAQEGRARALFAAEAEAAVVETVNEPFKTDRHFHQLTAQRIDHAVDHRGRDQRFADGNVLAPLRAMLEQIVDSDSEIVVRVHQTCRSDDAVAVVVRVVGERQIELIAQRQQARHRGFRGAVHTDSAVFIEVHKAESLIHLIVNEGEIELVVLRDALPVFDAGAAQRVDAKLQARFLDSGHVDDLRQPFDKRLHQIFFLNTTARPGVIQRNTFHAFQAVRQQRVCAVFDHFGDVGIRRAAVRRVVFDAAVVRARRRRDDDAVSLRAAAFVVFKDGVRDRRRRRITVVVLHDDIDAVRRQHFQHGDKRRLGERVRIFTDVARPGDAVFGALFGNRLGDSQNVRLVKTVTGGAAAVA